MKIATVYLIGPSGVGKSGIAASVASALSRYHLDLDRACKGWEGNWPVCLSAIEGARLEHPEGVIVDIGAGTQHEAGGKLAAYLSSVQGKVILVTGDSMEVFGRNIAKTGWADRSYDEYLNTEYTSRQTLNDLASGTVKVMGCDWDAAVRASLGIVHEG